MKIDIVYILTPTGRIIIVTISRKTRFSVYVQYSRFIVCERKLTKCRTICGGDVTSQNINNILMNYFYDFFQTKEKMLEKVACQDRVDE